MQSNTTARPGRTAPGQTPPLERELPMLAGIGAFITWCEDLLGLLSGPILTAGLAIALVDLLSNNALFSRVPTLLWVWACSMALGLDAQFIGSAAKAAKAMRQRRYWAATGYFILCGALGYVGFIASNVLATQEANGITTAEALARLGLDSTNWIVQRSVLAVVLVFLSGFLRYVAPGKNVATSTAEERERLEAELELEPLRAQLRNQKVRDMRAAALTAMGRDKSQQQQQQPQSPPQAVKPHIVAASLITPDPSLPTQHQGVVTSSKMMHDWDAADIPDEVEYGGVDSDPLGYATTITDVDDFDIDEPPESVTSGAKRSERGGKGSGMRAPRQNQSRTVRETHRAMRAEGKQTRKREIREAGFAILDERVASGLSMSAVVQDVSDHPVRFAEEIGKRAQLSVRPSANTALRLIGPWKSSRVHRASLDDIPDEITPMEPQELRELVATEAW